MRRVPLRLPTGIVLLVTGQALILGHWVPLSYYYFPFVWYGFILTLDGCLAFAGAPSLWDSGRASFMAMIPISATFWWIFELFDQAVHSWRYVGGPALSWFGYLVFASLCFSTVLLAVWETALVLTSVLANRSSRGRPGSSRFATSAALVACLGGGVRLSSGRQDSALDAASAPPALPRPISPIMAFSLLAGILCIVLPLLFPRYAFGLLWVCLFFILDPVNAWLGEPSLIDDVVHGRNSRPLTFACAALVCGFFWEFWNYWAAVRWVYNVPYVSWLHVFEMPLPGYLGYLPFGLEVFAATIFSLALARRLATRVSRRRSLPAADRVLGLEPN